MDNKKKDQTGVHKSGISKQFFLMFRKVKLSLNLNGGEYIPFNFLGSPNDNVQLV